MSVINEKPMTTCEDQAICNMDLGTLQNSLPQCSKLDQVCNSDNSLNKATIPVTAVPVKVTNIQNPYVMRAYRIKGYSKKLDEINRKLLRFVKSDNFLKRKNDPNMQEPKIGDMVLIQSNKEKHVTELPSFVCRGLITYIKDAVYNILFVDYGTSFELSRDQFCTIPHDFISNKYLTQVVGVYNILPVCMRNNTQGTLNDHKPATIVTEEKWHNKAIQFTRNLLIASRAVYFDHLFTDEKNDREYGEFYLIVDNIIVSLSEALIINYHATHFTGDLLQLIKNSSNVQHKHDTEEEEVIHIKFSTDKINKNCVIFNESDKHESTKKFCLSEKVLIHTHAENCGVLNNVTDLAFLSTIHKAWDKCMKSSRPRKLQSYVWPAIKKGLNVVAVGSSQCGKTSACVMAICGLVAMHQKELSRSATRPLALILCSSSFEVINVHSLCMSLLNTSGTRTIAIFNTKMDRSVAAMIYSGCHILVSTPRHLVRFLNDNSGLLSFDRLFYLVFDNADIILDKYYDLVGELFRKYNIIENREPQNDDRPLLQIIVSATYWTPQIKKFARLVMHNPYICITSFLEAIIFKSVQPRLYILKSKWKNKKISDILKDDYMTLKTMVVCANAEEAEELNAFLVSMTKKTLLIHEKMKPTDIQNLQEQWKACTCGSYPILICTDTILSELNFTDIQWLIHHSVLLKFKNQFNFRFSVLLDDLVQNSTKCKVSIIIDENNDVQLESILKLMTRMGVVIPPELQKNIARIAITLERDKKDYAICDNVKAFGFCQKRDVCVFRHCVLPEIDAPMTNIQVNDKVKLIVIHVHDTSHFSARIIEHIPYSDKSTEITFSNVEYMQITAKLQEYYQNTENRKMCTSTDVGDICVFEEPIDTFKRVQIRCIQHNKSSEEVKFVNVRCIDTGIVYTYIDSRKLIHIPEELRKLSTHTMEVFLTDIAPCDDEYMWNYYSKNVVNNWFSENFDQRSYIIGKVRFHLGDTIWLDDFEIGTKLIGHADLIGFSLKKRLISENYAVLNKDHVSRLFELCKHSGLTEVNGYNIDTCK